MILHRADERGSANHGWLFAKHSFSFASWYNPEKINFGALRVLNDDTIAPNAGFPTHPHDNMEIITIPLEGAIEHRDSMGNTGVIRTGEIQVMSAGSGVYHSEYNASATETLKLFQIWIFPNKRGVEPRYDQLNYLDQVVINSWNNIVGPDEEDNRMMIHQNAWISIGEFETNHSVEYKRFSNETGIYLMLISGQAMVNDQILNDRDAVGFLPNEKLVMTTRTETKMLLLEVPMIF